MIIPSSTRRGRRAGPPSISIRSSAAQQSIAFNSRLCSEFLGKTRYVMVAVEPTRSETYFIPCGETYKNQPAYKLSADGGSNKASGKVIYLSSDARRYFMRVRAGSYPAKLLRGKIVIKTPGVGLGEP